MTPAPRFTKGALGAVPVVVGLWPVLLTGIYAISRRKEKISREETRAEVAAAVAAAKADAQAEFEKKMDLAKKQKEKEIELRVKQALEEAERARKADESPDTEEDA